MSCTPNIRVEPRCERVEGVDEVVAWEVWWDDDWQDSFDNETDAIDFRAHLQKLADGGAA